MGTMERRFWDPSSNRVITPPFGVKHILRSRSGCLRRAADGLPPTRHSLIRIVDPAGSAMRNEYEGSHGDGDGGFDA